MACHRSLVRTFLFCCGLSIVCIPRGVTQPTKDNSTRHILCMRNYSRAVKGCRQLALAARDVGYRYGLNAKKGVCRRPGSSSSIADTISGSFLCALPRDAPAIALIG